MEHSRTRKAAPSLLPKLHLVISAPSLPPPMVSLDQTTSATAFPSVSPSCKAFSSGDTSDKCLILHSSQNQARVFSLPEGKARHSSSTLPSLFPLREKGQGRQNNQNNTQYLLWQPFPLPRSFPETVNLCGLCPVHKPT